LDLSRQKRLVGEDGQKKLAESHVAVFGIGGVGGYAAEAIARAGVGTITLVDSDVVTQSNVNRQIIANRGTIGVPKVDVMAARIQGINPDCTVYAEQVFIDAENITTLLSGVTYAADAVDTVSAKLAIIEACSKMGIPAVCAMGAGNKLEGTFEVTDVFDTKEDALARVMRRELRKRGIEKQKVVCTGAKPLLPLAKDDSMPSISYMPGLCGLTMAGEIIRDIIGTEQ